MTYRKGNELQRKAAHVLEDEGYMVHVTVRTSYNRGGRWFSQSNDVFNAFDILASKIGEPVRWIQVTTISNVSQRIKKVVAVPLDPEHNSVEVWGWKGGSPRKHKVTGEWLPRQYFQVYYANKEWRPDPEDRVFLKK